MSSLFLVAPVPAFADDDEMFAALEGRTLTAGPTVLTLDTGGALHGSVGPDTLEGDWSISNGRFCRTINAPERLAGSECQRMEINGGRATITSPRGSQVYTLD
ncbi:hypothetical protein [Maritimibacter sp. DP1N21-5]|uniref:hypothetical protein n=1 Tax=Maritimibacter sp. DP1N21-5 TaxID=2836867 RepID=UPI001C47A1B0|nr:hypothetical protein [Maritimibacter sp. DP1N21-5]MBV7409698.1 hypothetical protein [Maritimibacter sp. DP1N21-5]